ncbi:hypothetical protein SAMN05518672_104369 [Chitinophaga sp. CF118]|nr:hypothetical protein SAMN05518672_104369 [Chitinophaga sp. CF118]
MISPKPSEHKRAIEPNSFKLPYIAAVASFMAAILVAYTLFL